MARGSGRLNRDSVVPNMLPATRPGGVTSAGRRAALRLTLIVCLIGCLASCTPASLAGTRPMLKIGLVAAFEGLERPLGYQALQGVKLALARRNAAGGVAGYLVELVALNDFGRPDDARSQARQLAVDPAVVGVITGWSDETARAALPEYRHAGLAVVVPWSVSPELADARAGIVLAAADTRRVAERLSRIMAADQPGRVIVTGKPAALEPFLAQPGLLAQGLPPPVSYDSVACKAWALRLVAGRPAPPDALVLAMPGALAGQALRALAEAGWRGSAYGDAEAGSGQLVDVAGRLAEGLIFVSPAPAGQDLSDDARQLADPPARQLAPRGVLAYDATQVLLDAIQAAIQADGRPERRGVVEALPSVQRRGLSGPLAFDQQGRRLEAPLWVYRIAEGAYPGRLLDASWP